MALEGGRTCHPGDGSVGGRPGELEHLRAERGDEHREGSGARDVERAVRAQCLAPAGHRPLVDEGHQDREVLPHVADRLLERVTEHPLDHELVREPDAKGQPPAADGLGGHRLGREHHRDGAGMWGPPPCRARSAVLRARPPRAMSARRGRRSAASSTTRTLIGRSPGGRHDLVDAAVSRHFAAEDPDAHAAQAIQASGADRGGRYSRRLARTWLSW